MFTNYANAFTRLEVLCRFNRSLLVSFSGVVKWPRKNEGAGIGGALPIFGPMNPRIMFATKPISAAVWLLIFNISTTAQNLWPANEWSSASPATLGLNIDSLNYLDNELQSGRYGYIDGMLVIRHGQIAFEKSYGHDYSSIYKKEATEKGALNSGDPTGPYNYFNSWWHPFFHRSELHTMQSVTKTITSAIIGVAISRNEFPDLNTPVIQFFDTSQIGNLDARKRHMTIRHLLTMTAGFKWNENLPYADPNNSCSIMEACSDWVKYTMDQPMSDEPGSVFNYNSGATEILGYIFHVATGHDIEEYAARYLFTPIGIKNYYWKRSPSGLADTEGGLYLEKKDLARVCYLYLKEGKWGDRQLISKDYVKQSVTPYVSIMQKTSYGYKWWLTQYGNSSAETAWRGSGFGGQLPIIFAQYDMVVVFTAWNILPDQARPGIGFLIRQSLHCVNDYNNKGK